MLLDRMNRRARDLRISVTDRCNFRCLYCMPDDRYTWIAREEILRFEEITRLTRAFVTLGVDKIRLTGGEPVVYLDRSNLVAPGQNVLTTTQLFELATALDKIHAYFRTAYGTGVDWYAMDIEWKFERLPGETPQLYIKQARPFQE